MFRIIGFAFLAGALSAQQAPPPPPAAPGPPTWTATSPVGAPKAFEVASVKIDKTGFSGMMGGFSSMAPYAGFSNMQYGPGRLTLTGGTIEGLIIWAWSIKQFQLVNEPAWSRSDRFDIDARAQGAPDPEHLKLLLQALLEERFQLKLHHETRELPVFLLETESRGTKMRQSIGPLDPAKPQSSSRGGDAHREFTADHFSMKQMISLLTREVNKPVIDKTGFTGMWDFHMEWTPDLNLNPQGTPLTTALHEQLGLKLESSKGPVDVLVIDHVNRIPTEN